MKKILLLLIVISMLISACSEVKKETGDTGSVTAASTAATDNVSSEIATKQTGDTISTASAAIESETSSGTAAETTGTSEQDAGKVYKPSNSSEISKIFVKSIPLFVKSLSLDLSAFKLKADDANVTVLNAYYDALGKNPILKYAYSIDVKYDSSTSVADCFIKYMPYKTVKIDTEKLPARTYKISNLHDLIEAADLSTGKINIPIAIMNRELEVETMQKALMQAGYGYIVYSFNDDATGLIASPTNGRTLEQCVSYINKMLALADEISSKIITAGMTPDEKIAAVYKYITGNVKYDMRYYTNKKAMPYESTTAYGAYKDNLAICGGYSWAFNILLSKAGIECYNVSGSAAGEYHMWNAAKYKNGYYYFDCTFDRGRTEGYRYFAGTEGKYSEGHIWEKSFMDQLVNGASGE